MIPPAKDKPLYTPGPLTTSLSVKQAMMHDLGSRDGAFVEIVRSIRARLVALATANTKAFVAVPIQGSGTYAVEAVFSSCVPRGGSVLVVSNGAYGERMAKIADTLAIEHTVLRFPEDQVTDPGAVCEALAAGRYDMVAIVHCETTTGILNPIGDVGEVVRKAGAAYFVDAMSSFGGIPLDMEQSHIDYLVSSANKCIEGVPGFSFVIARKTHFDKTKGLARSLCLDLYGQCQGLDQNGQFRFTPPTHALLAFHQALLELESEGGPAGRMARYERNHQVLVEGMRAIGFQEYLDPAVQGPIITSFRYPEGRSFSFETFYNALNDHGFVIYPGKVSNADCFRIGHIGRLFEADMRNLVRAIASVAADLDLFPSAP